MEITDRGWKFLAEVAKARREHIGLNQEDLKEFGGPGKSTVGKIENARQRSFPPRTQQQLARVLGWNRSAVRDILLAPESEHFEEDREGILLEYVEDAPLPDLLDLSSAAAGTLAALSNDALVAEVARRLTAATAAGAESEESEIVG